MIQPFHISKSHNRSSKMLLTLSSVRNSLQKNMQKNIKHSQSMNNFVLLNSKRQLQENYQWKPLQVTQNIRDRCNSLNREISFGGSYHKKKSILGNLKKSQKILKNPDLNSQKLIKTDSFMRSKFNYNFKQTQQTNESQQQFSSAKITSSLNRLKMQIRLNKFVNTTDNFNEKVFKTLNKLSQNRKNQIQDQPKAEKTQEETLINTIRKASLKNQRIIAVFTVKRYGLRMRLNHSFVSVCTCRIATHANMHKFSQNAKLTERIQEMLLQKNQDKNLYYFHLNKQSIQSSDDLEQSQYVIIAASHPLLHLDTEFHFKLYEQAEKIEKIVKNIQKKVSSEVSNKSQKTKNKLYKSPTKKYTDKKAYIEQNHDQSTKYEWQMIPNVQQYVQQICQNPQNIHRNNQSRERGQISFNKQIRTWYNQKFSGQISSQTGQGFRNPLLQDHHHYHEQLKNKKILHQINLKLQNYEGLTKNKHINKRQSLQTVQNKIRQQKLQQQNQQKNPNIPKRNILDIHKSKKSILRQLDQKNSLLFQQNIPYIMDKYGINRYEIHNLFAIYKTLEKISAMKFQPFQMEKKVIQKGIDRETFDEGMKRLDINPGDEVVKNICYIGDFISWENFIKIVSIGLRKTLEEKLQAILSGIGGANSGFLSRNQISIMIGNSLNKMFDSQQVELRDYFTQVAMKDLDSDNSGHIQFEQIKNKILVVNKNREQNGQNIDLVTFLLLNS